MLRRFKWRSVFSYLFTILYTTTMPPRRKKVKSTNPEVLRLTEAMTKYYFLLDTCSQCIRGLPNRSQIYKEAVENWQHRSEFYRPRRGDESDKARFFSAVDEVCKIESRSPEKCVLNPSLYYNAPPHAIMYPPKLLFGHLCVFGWHSGHY